MSNEITVVHQAVAEAQGFQVYKTYNESEATKFLKLSLSTLRRIRRLKQINFIQKGKRQIAYFGFHLSEYLIAQSSCHDMQQKTDTKLAITGCHKNQIRQHGIEHGSTLRPSKQDELASAQAILRRPKLG